MSSARPGPPAGRRGPVRRRSTRADRRSPIGSRDRRRQRRYWRRNEHRRRLPPRPAGAAGHELVETQMTDLVAAVRGEYHIAERRGCEQSAQRFEPADEPAAALGGRLPPRTARRHDDDRCPCAVNSGDRDDDVASASRCPAARRHEPRRRSASGGCEHSLARLARNMNCRRAVRAAEPLGIQQPKAGLRPRADDHEAAMRCVAPQPFAIRGIDAAGRQLGHRDRRFAADGSTDGSKDTGDASGGRGGGVEHRNTGDMPAAAFQIGVSRVEAIEREIFDPGRSAKAGRLADQPVGAGLVARRSGAMDALSILCGQPRRRAGRAVVRHAPLNPRR
jgi:hypothetical protein